MEDFRYKKIVGSLSADKEDIERVIGELREAGANQIDTIKLLMKKLGIRLAEADSLVLDSKAWNDQRESTLELRNCFWDVLEKCACRVDRSEEVGETDGITPY